MTATDEPQDDAPTGGPRRSGFRGAATWSFVMEGGRQALNVGIAFLLAAMLGPEAYGTVAIAMVFISFLDLLQRQGMAAALIQRKDLTQSHRDTAFWMLMAASMVLFATTLALAGWWARVNDLPELRLVIIALSPMIPLQALSLVQDALLRRQMAFRSLAIRSVTAVVAGGVAGVTAALAGWGVYALVAQQLTLASVAAIVLWSVSDWRPHFRLDRQSARELLGFSSGSFLASMATFVNNQADALLIGLFFGPFVVGIYRLGLRLVETLVTAFLRPVQAIALPELAPHQDDPPELSRRVERLMRLGGVITLPLLGVLAGAADPLVAVLGGDWAAAADVIPVLCVVGAVRVFVVVDGPLLQAVGSPFLQAASAAAAAVMSAVSFIGAGLLLQDVAPADQALGIAVARAAVWGIGIMALHVVIMRRFGGFTFRRMMKPFLWPLAAGVLGGAAAAVADALTASAMDVLRVVASAGAGALLAFGLLWARVPELPGLASDVLRRRRRRPPATAAPSGPGGSATADGDRP